MIPAEIRRELGIEPGDELIPKIEDGRLVLDRREDALRRLQEIYARIPTEPGRLLSEELVAERREEARREEEKWRRLGLD